MSIDRFNKKQLVLLLIFSLIVVHGVAAANVFDDAFQSFGNLSPDFYDNHWWWLDLAAYAFFFIAVCQFALKGKMGDEKGKLGIIVGAVLAGTLVIYELRSGTRLANLAPLALFLISFVLGAVVYNFAKGMGASQITAFSFGFLTTDIFLFVQGATLIASLESMKDNNAGVAILLGAFKLGLPLAAVGVIYTMIKAVINFFKGGTGAISFSGEKKALEKAGDAAKWVKGKVASDENKEAADESVEEKEEKRQLADLSRITTLTKYGINDAAGMKTAINIIIGLLKSTKGRLTPTVLPEMEAKLHDIEGKSTEIQNVTRQMAQTIADLETAEREEYNLAQNAATNARSIFAKEIGGAAGKLTRPQVRKLAAIQIRIEKDIQVRAARKWADTKRDMEGDKNKIIGYEVEFGKLIQGAVAASNPSRYNEAITLLTKANAQLDIIEHALKEAGTKLVDNIRRQISAELKELRVEKNLIARFRSEFRKP